MGQRQSRPPTKARQRGKGRSILQGGQQDIRAAQRPCQRGGRRVRRIEAAHVGAMKGVGQMPGRWLGPPVHQQRLPAGQPGQQAKFHPLQAPADDGYPHVPPVLSPASGVSVRRRSVSQRA